MLRAHVLQTSQAGCEDGGQHRATGRGALPRTHQQVIPGDQSRSAETAVGRLVHHWVAVVRGVPKQRLQVLELHNDRDRLYRAGHDGTDRHKVQVHVRVGIGWQKGDLADLHNGMVIRVRHKGICKRLGREDRHQHWQQHLDITGNLHQIPT